MHVLAGEDDIIHPVTYFLIRSGQLHVVTNRMYANYATYVFAYHLLKQWGRIQD